MKRTASLFSQIVDYKNLRFAWLKARKRCAFLRPGNASHHAIMNVLGPVFERQFIFHTYA